MVSLQDRCRAPLRGVPEFVFAIGVSMRGDDHREPVCPALQKPRRSPNSSAAGERTRNPKMAVIASCDVLAGVPKLIAGMNIGLDGLEPAELVGGGKSLQGSGNE